MNAETNRKLEELCRLADEAERAADKTADPSHERALRLVALRYHRLADYVRASARALVKSLDPPRTS